jgi:rSAM/selenodomain-associated transferase 1
MNIRGAIWMQSPPLRKDTCTLVIMAKAPRPGAVKTRLARTLPVLEVTDLYRCLLVDTIALAKSLDGVELAIMCPEADAQDLVRATGNSISVVPQNGNGLTAGLTSVFAHFASAGAGRIVAFNSDTPHLPPSYLERAFRLLASCDVVIGPTHDGGYYLVGAKAPHPGLFVTDAMGTTSAYEALLARVRGLNLSFSLIDSFYDIDELSDLDQLADELLRSPGKAPRTADWLLARPRRIKHAKQNGGAT